jgi:hypothetical protein
MRTPRFFAVLVLALATTVLASEACSVAARRSGAMRIAAAYVTADTSGRWKGADSLVNWNGCDVDPATDFLQPTVLVNVVEGQVHGDTVDVRINYAVLGRLSSEDSHFATSPTQNWHFTAAPTTDQVVLHIIPDAGALPPIVCGELHFNHVGLSEMSHALAHMDDSSRAAFERARRNARTARIR